MQPETLEFSAPPALPPQYAKALLKRNTAKTAVAIPLIAARVRAVQFDREQLAAYRKVCGFPREDVVPITFPQVMAVPLHAAIMLDDRFPYPLLGIVHVRNRFEQMKLYSLLQPDVVAAIVTRAHELGMTVTGHVPTALGIRRAVEVPLLMPPRAARSVHAR